MRTILFSLGLLFIVVNGFSQQVAKSTTYKNTFVGFLEYKPTNYNANKKYPLIIFLHGIGERGNGTSDLQYLTWQGIPKNIAEGKTMTFTVKGKTETFLVLSPQLPKWMGAWDNLYVDAMLEYAKKNLSVDDKRIFLTGISLGGGGVWSYVTASLNNAKKFAAIAPICGVCFYDFKQLEPTIGKAGIGVWGFANMDDNIVSPWCTISAIDELAKSKSKKIKKTINQWGGHDAWTKAYDVGSSVNSPNLYEWFLSESESGDDDDDDDDRQPSQNQSNAAPVAKAGNDVWITLPENKVTLNNSGSYDSDGNIKAWNWMKVSGPYAHIVSANNASTSVNDLVAGTYVFRLTVTDNQNATATDDITVVVNPAANAAPVAKAGNNISITLPDNKVTLNNSGSYDSDGSIKAWNWSKVSGPSQFSIASANSASTAVNNLEVGTYVFRLTVTDDDNATGTADVTVTVNRAANTAPVAKAGNDVHLALPANSTTLNSAGSYDAEGKIKKYSWSKVSGPSKYSISNDDQPTTEVKNLEVGTYTFRLTVTDEDNATASDEVIVNVNRAPNVAPVAKAGNDVNLTLPANYTTLNNAGSYDSDGTIRGYSWSKLSGPSAFRLTSPLGATTEVLDLQAGSYTFRLTVTDDDGATSSDDVTVNVNRAPNVAPVAKAGNDVNLTLPSNSTSLSNSGSYDSDGSIKGYSWTKVSGPAQYRLSNPLGASTELLDLQAGSYTFRLTVTDDNGATASDDVTVNVNRAANIAPVAKAGNDVNLTLPSNSTSLSNSGSYDADGSIKGYIWTKVSGPAAYRLTNPLGANTELLDLQAGSYVFRLTVTDEDGATATDEVTIHVNRAPNVAPVAKAGNDVNITLPFNSTTLSNSGSYDSDGSIKGFNWTKISGPSGFRLSNPVGAHTEVSDLQVGSYVFRLTVTDEDGATASDDVTVNVNRGANVAPVAKAGNDVNLILPSNSTTLNNAGSYDADGSIRGYTWTKVSGPSQFRLANPLGASTQVLDLEAGSYIFRLTVTDDDGALATDDVLVVVTAESVSSTKGPVAVAGKDELIPVGQATMLHGEYSYAQSGVIRSYAWTKFSGPGSHEMLTPNAQNTWIRNMQEGVYVYRLTVTDNNGAVATDEVTITVKGMLPVAVAGKDETIPEGQATMLRGDNSYVLRGNILSYFWLKLSGPASYEIMEPNSKSTWIRKMTPGVYVYRLMVKDDNGYLGVDDVTITVKDGSVHADAGKDETIPQGQATVLRGDLSYSSAGGIKSYSWTKVSGPANYEILNPESKNSWVRNMVPGNYIYRLTITDIQGVVGYDEVAITVTQPGVTAGRSGTEANGQDLTPVETAQSSVNTALRLNLYPNPVVNTLNIRWSGEQKGAATMNVVDAGGRIVRTLNVKKDNLDLNTSIDVTSLAPGIYTIQILLQNGKPLNKQFLKR